MELSDFKELLKQVIESGDLIIESTIENRFEVGVRGSMKYLVTTIKFDGKELSQSMSYISKFN